MSKDKSIIAANLLSAFTATTTDVEGPDIKNIVSKPSTTTAFEDNAYTGGHETQRTTFKFHRFFPFSLRKLEASLIAVELEDSGSSPTIKEVELTMIAAYDTADFPSLIKTVNQYIHNTRLRSHLLFSPLECSHISHHFCHLLQEG